MSKTQSLPAQQRRGQQGAAVKRSFYVADMLALSKRRQRAAMALSPGRLAGAIALGLALAQAPCALHAQDAQAQAKSAATSKTKKKSDKQQAQNVATVVVTGLRASMQSSEALKRNSDQIVDAVTATDINALPDRTVTETLQRISGVTVDHFLADDDPDHPSAEGSGVLIRGLPYVASELNGRATFSANNGRALSFEDVPAELMSGVYVYKNPAANMIEGGIGGTVDLRTRLPFDTGDMTAFSYGVNRGDMSRKSKPSASFLYSHTWKTESAGQFGALFDVSYSELNSRNDGIQINPYVLRPDGTDTSYYAPNIAAGSSTSNVYVPGDINWQQMDMHRRRIGLYGALQWRPTKDLEITSQFFRSNYNLRWNEHWAQTNESNYNNILPAPGTQFTYNGQGIFQSGTVGSNAWKGSPPSGPNGSVEYYAANRLQTQFSRTTDWSNSFKYNVNDHILLTGSLQFVKSYADTLDFSIYNQFYMPPAKLDVSGSTPSLTVSDPSFFADKSNYYLAAAMDHVEHDYGMERAARLDMQYFFDDSNWLSELQVGVRATNHDAYSNNLNSNYNWGPISQPWQGAYNGSNLDWLNTIPASMSQQYTMPNFFRGANVPTTLWFPSNALVSNYASAIQQLYKVEFANSGSWQAQVPGQAGENNHMKQHTEAAYAMLFFGNQIGSIPFDGNIGVRLVHTGLKANGSVQYPSASNISGSTANLTPAQLALFSGDYVPISGKNSYNNVLPSLNLRFHLTHDLQWRLAASKAMSRPPIYQLNSYAKLGASWGGAAGAQAHITGWTGSTGGNPRLKPMEATQFDSTLEWYFAPTGQLYGDVFYKKIKNYITNEIHTETYSGQPFAISGPVNAGTGQIRGISLGYSQFFNFLPGALKGLGVQANYTFLQSSKISGTTSCDPDHANGSCSSEYVVTNPPLPMAGLSPHSYNVTGMYEYGKWSARLAWSWRSRYLITSQDSGDTYLPMWNDSYGHLDASFFYSIDKEFKIGLLMNNLTNARTHVLMGPATYAGATANNTTTAAPGFVDYNLYTRGVFVNDRRYELVLRAKFK